MSNSQLKSKINLDLTTEINNKTNFKNDLESVDKLEQTLDKLQIVKNLGLKNESSIISDKNKKPEILSNTLLYQNKLIDFNWQILLESCSSELKNINQIKIAVCIKYLNTLNLEIKELNLVLTEENFHHLLDEINKLEKYF